VKYFSSICAIQLELNYANLGWKELIEDGSGNTYQRSLNYIQMPMLMHMGWGREQRGVKFFINAGPQIGLYIDGSEEYGGGVWDTANRPNGVVYQYGKEVENSFDYGIAGGLGLELSTGIGHFLLEGRYYYGLGDVFDNSKKGDFYCLVCGGIKKKMWKRFKDCVALIQHSTTVLRTKRKRAHRAFAQVVCKVIGWDINQLPTIVLKDLDSSLATSKKLLVNNHSSYICNFYFKFVNTSLLLIRLC
jgi:hypothetical protein